MRIIIILHNFEKKTMEYTNKTMSLINNLTDEIYESLADKDYTQLNKSIIELLVVLKEIQQSIKDEI